MERVTASGYFFITSSDSGSFVDDMVTSGGNPNPPVANRVFWGISEGTAAAVLLVLLLARGRAASIAVGIGVGRFATKSAVARWCAGLIKILRQEPV